MQRVYDTFMTAEVTVCKAYILAANASIFRDFEKGYRVSAGGAVIACCGRLPGYTCRRFCIITIDNLFSWKSDTELSALTGFAGYVELPPMAIDNVFDD